MPYYADEIWWEDGVMSVRTYRTDFGPKLPVTLSAPLDFTLEIEKSAEDYIELAEAIIEAFHDKLAEQTERDNA